ncbi:MAG: OB-fold nucleic acid binding domain-containing protein, partial [Polyangiaceae bacterium]
PEQASKYLGRTVIVEGTVKSAVDHLPKALYLGFQDPHDGALLIRIFAKDLPKFTQSPLGALGKKVRVRGRVTLYWPESRDPEIVVRDPSDLEF